MVTPDRKNGYGFRHSPLWGLKSAGIAGFLGGFEKMEKGSAIEIRIFLYFLQTDMG